MIRKTKSLPVSSFILKGAQNKIFDKKQAFYDPFKIFGNFPSHN